MAYNGQELDKRLVAAMELIGTIETWLIQLTETIPVELYVFLGAIIEEIIAPIPSPVIMTLAGSLAQAQGYGIAGLLLLAVLGAAGKTLASLLIYFISDKAEDVIVGRFGKYLGVSTKEIEKIGQAFNGGKRDTILLVLARAIPIMPTTPVSIVCGVIKLDLKAYTLGTFIGTTIRGMEYLLLGYLGLASAESLLTGMDSLEKVVQLFLAIVGFVLILLLFMRRRSEQNLIEKIKVWFRLK